jgi:TusA-related sulfurtransferase
MPSTPAFLPFGKPATVSIDLRKTKCPLNFVKAKLALEKLPLREVLEVWLLSSGDSALNVPRSFEQEGHSVSILPADGDDETLQILHIQRR